ncbi:putative enoyl-CoA hydratase echA12 [bacterium HR29]|jgi:enoyl-CoA hydratase/carnithine racemase|nr:putative enoyl-CoA hydratase echA12 [bacterium HR29]
METIRWESNGPVGFLTLARPERLNALNYQMVRELRRFFEARHRDFATRVIVITGEGRGFCAGLDLKAGAEQGPWIEGVGPVQTLFAFQEDIAELMVLMRRCPQPLIAAVNGPAAGGGLSLTLACDYRIATDTARFACSYVNLGLSGCDVGSSYFLPKLVGPAWAADMIYSGRLVDASEALRIGLVNELVPREELLARARAVAEEWIRRSSPLGLRLSKEVLNETVAGVPLETALKLENRNQVLAAQTADAAEARAAFLERREPRWADA